MAADPYFIGNPFSVQDAAYKAQQRTSSAAPASGFGGTSMAADLAAGASRADAGVNAAQGGVNAVLAGGGQIRSDTNAMRSQAGLVNQQGNALNATARDVRGVADALVPYADTLGGYGDALWGQGNALWDQSNDAFGQAAALANLDPSAGGLSREFINYLNILSPERYSGRMASDAQAEFDNAAAQQERALARRGVSAGSGAGMALRQQLDRAKAVARAAARQMGWQKGADERGAYLSTMTNAAKTFYDMGSESGQLALGAQNAAANAQNAAAGIQKDRGGLIVQAGGLQYNAGQLFSNAASIFGSAAGIENNYLETVNKAYMGLSSAYDAAARYYSGAAGLMSRGGGGGGGGGSTSTGRHYGVGGELLETGNDKIDAQLQMARDAVPTTYEKNLGLA